MGREGEREKATARRVAIVKDYDLEESSQESVLVFLEAKVDETWNGNDFFWESDRQSFKHNADKKGSKSIISGF